MIKVIGKPFLTIVLIALLTVSAAVPLYAAETNKGRKDVTVTASGQYISSCESSGFLFLFSSALINHRSTGGMVLLFSTAELNAEIDGDVYLLFSELRLGPGASINGTVHTLSSRVTAAVGNEPDCVPLISALSVFQNISTAGDTTVVISDKIEYIGMYLSVLMIAFCLLSFAVKKSFIVQGSMLIYREPLELMRNGIAFYFAFLVLAILFAATVFLAPLTVAGLGVFLLLHICGEASIAMVVGRSVMEAIGLKPSSALSMAIGLFLLEAIRHMPYLGWGYSYLFLPILCCGTAFTAFLDGALFKRFYPDEFYDGKPASKLDFAEIQGILRK